MNKLFRFIIAFHVLPISLLWTGAALNSLPGGFFFGSGDIIQPFLTSNLLENNWSLYSFDNGFGGFNQSFPYTGYYYLLDFFNRILPALGINTSEIFIFLFGAYFFSFIGFCDLKSNILTRQAIAFIYAINPISLYLFLYTWGYSPFPVIYLFLPLLFRAYLGFIGSRLFSTENYYWLMVFSISSFLCSFSFGNFAWFACLLILFGVIWVALLLFTPRSLSRYAVCAFRGCILLLVFLTASAWAFVPSLLPMLDLGNQILADTWWWSVDDWVIQQSGYYREAFGVMAPSFFYNSLEVNLVPLFSGVLLIGLILGLVNFDSRNSFSRDFILLLFAIIFLIFVYTKGRFFMGDELRGSLFSNLWLIGFKSSDKALILFPSLFLLLVCCVLKSVRSCRVKRWYIGLAVGFSMLSSYPLITGGIQTHFSLAFSGGQNYLTSDVVMIHELPSDYFTVAEILNGDPAEGAVLALPYTVDRSLGWVEYPKWRYFGEAPENLLITRGVIQPNQHGFLGPVNYGEFMREYGEYGAISFILKLINPRFLLIHKDANVDLWMPVLKYISDCLEVSCDHQFEMVFEGQNLVLVKLVEAIGISPIIVHAQSTSESEVGFLSSFIGWRHNRNGTSVKETVSGGCTVNNVIDNISLGTLEFEVHGCVGGQVLVDLRRRLSPLQEVRVGAFYRASTHNIMPSSVKRLNYWSDAIAITIDGAKPVEKLYVEVVNIIDLTRLFLISLGSCLICVCVWFGFIVLNRGGGD